MKKGAMKKLAPAANALVLIALLAFAVWRYRVNADELENAFNTKIPTDLVVYLLGGEKVANHQPLYDGDLTPGLPFTYPPFAGVVFSWFGAPTEALGVAWNVASVVVLALVIKAASSSKTSPVLLLTAFFVLCTEPVHATLFYGQINIFLMGLVCLDFLPRRYRLPGIGTGLAAGMKLTPAFFLLLLALEGRWGAVFVAAFTFLCTVATGFAEVSDAGSFWTDAIFNSNRVGDADNPGAQAMRQVMHRELGVDSTAAWVIAAVAVTALAALAAHIALRRRREALAVSFIGMAACLVSPFSWYHHWVWVVIFGVVIYNAWGVLALVVAMLPYSAYNVAHGLYPVPGLWFTLLPLISMLIYAAYGLFFEGHSPVPRKGSHRAHPSRGRDSRGRSHPHPRPGGAR